MKRRLTIARSLVNEPEVLLLDEPTTGLDPQARHVVWDRLYRLKRQGVTLAPDDALHGRGRAALRPARRHGSREDRRRGLAARPHRAVLDARGRRAALRRREPSRRSELLDGRRSSSRVEALPGSRAPVHARTATPRRTSSTSAASSRRASSSAAARSRTSSSTSPAGASSNDHRSPSARGRGGNHVPPRAPFFRERGEPPVPHAPPAHRPDRPMSSSSSFVRSSSSSRSTRTSGAARR